MVIMCGRVVSGAGCRAAKPWLMPSALTVGSKERVSFSFCRCLRKMIRCAVEVIRSKESVTEDVIVRPRLSGSSFEKKERSVESKVDRGGVLKASRSTEKLRAQAKAITMAVVGTASRERTAVAERRSQ